MTTENLDPDYAVIGRKCHVGYVMPLNVVRGDQKADAYKAATRYAIWYARSGSAFIGWGGEQFMIVAPVVVLLSVGQSLTIRKSLNLDADVVYFMPNIINEAFTFEALRAGGPFKKGPMNDDYFLIRYFGSKQHNQKIRYLRPSTKERVEELMTRIENENQTQVEKWPCRSRSFLLELLICICINGAETPVGPVRAVRDPKLDEILLFIHDHFVSKVTVEDLAERFGTNRTSLNALFQNAMGTSIHRYIMNLRIHLACALLRDTKLPVNEIMSRIGYDDPSHFTHIFKQVMDTTPSKYRAEQCWID